VTTGWISPLRNFAVDESMNAQAVKALQITGAVGVMEMLQQLSLGESGYFSSKTCWMPRSRGFVLVVKLASWPTPQIPKALRRL
jgi:hypothetical protein